MPSNPMNDFGKWLAIITVWCLCCCAAYDIYALFIDPTCETVSMIVRTTWLRHVVFVLVVGFILIHFCWRYEP